MDSYALKKFREMMFDDKIVPIKDATERNGIYTDPFPTGFYVFDQAMKGGVREGDLVVICGQSGHGKTTVAQNITVNLSKQAFPCLWFSYEMMIDNVYAKFKEMGIDEEFFCAFAPKKLLTGNLEWVKKKIKEGVEEQATKFIFIDHIDFLAPVNSKNMDQKRMYLKQIAQELKSMAMDLKVCIFLIAHVKKVYGREIEMQDIAESGGIYQLSDYVMAVNRKSKIETDQSSRKKIETYQEGSYLKLLKNRYTGNLATFDFKLENNIIKPDGFVPADFFEKDNKRYGD